MIIPNCKVVPLISLGDKPDKSKSAFTRTGKKRLIVTVS